MSLFIFFIINLCILIPFLILIVVAELAKPITIPNKDTKVELKHIQ